MTRKQALTDLLAKVEAGEYPITWRAFDCDQLISTFIHSAHNGSLDAAKALHEAVLPGWGVTFYGGFVPSGKYGIIVSKARYGEPRNQYTGSATNPARAWLIAIIKALIAQEAGK